MFENKLSKRSAPQQIHCFKHFVPPIRLRNLTLLLFGIILVTSCKSTPETTPTPTPLPATPIWQSSVAPTSTVVDSGLQVIDDGSPLPVRVIEQEPPAGQGLSLTGAIVLRFNQEMDALKTASAVQLVGPDGNAVRGQVTWPDAQTLRFKPSTALAIDSQYRMLIGQEASSTQGRPLDEPMEWSFATVGELQVSQTFPENGTFDVASDSVITTIFNQPVVPLVIAEERDTLPDPLEFSPPLTGQGEWVSTSVFAFRPGVPLRGGTTYTVTVKAGLEDAVGETELQEDYIWNFTTITPSIDYFELESGPRNPGNNRIDVLLDESFTIHFLQPMDPSSSETALSLISSGGAPVVLETHWDEENTSVTIIPEGLLDLGTTYTLRLDASARSIHGNSLRQGLNWTFTTIPEPSVLYFSPPVDMRSNFFNRNLMIQFASPMRIDTVTQRIEIDPKPETEFEWFYNEFGWNIRAFVLEPSTTYEVRVLPGVEDIYGNATAQEYSATFTTPAASPSAGLQMPFQSPLMRTDGPQEFYATYLNVSRIDLNLYRLEDREYVNFLNNTLQEYNYVPSNSALIWERRESSSADLNERVFKTFQPTEPGGSPLQPGYYFLTLDTPDIQHPYSTYLDQRIFLVADVNLTFKTTTNEALIWATELTSGDPIPQLPLAVYDEFYQRLGGGTTDADGLLRVSLPTPDDPYEDRFVITDGGERFGFAYGDWGSGVNQFDFGIWTSYYAPGNQTKGYVYTDRPIYRPNQPVYFKGIVRADDDLEYSQVSYENVQVVIDSFKETIFDEILPLSSFGSFDGELLLDQDAVLGYYSIQVYAPGSSDYLGGVGFTVAEYRKPEFQVQVSASPENVLSADDYSVTIAADYYSGGGVSDATVEWRLTSNPFTFSPDSRYSGYNFSDLDADLGFTREFGGVGFDLVAEGEGTTNALGQLLVPLTADLSEYEASRTFTFEATITDISRNTVSGRTQITAHQSAYYPGVRPSTYVGTAGQEQSFDLIVLDWDSEPIPGSEVQVEIVERRWHSVQEQDASGQVHWTSTVEEIPVASEGVSMDGGGRGVVNFTPPNGGVFKAIVTVLDSQGNRAKSSAFMWVAGSGYIPWRQNDDRSFDLVADRSDYSPGDTAEILIASPFQGEAYALVTIERGHIYQEDVLHLTSNSTLYKLPITDDLAPNFFVSVVVIKGIDESNPRPDFKMGIIELNVDTRDQEVIVTVTPDRPEAGPGERVNYTIRTTDVQGSPVDAELSVGLSDLATLSLAGPNAEPIVDFFYNRRTLGVWTSIPITLSLEDYNATIAPPQIEGDGMGSGGGKGIGDFGVTEVRQDFPDTALWNAHVLTGSDGEATVTVTLPDNLTTWRMDARAVSADTKVGSTEQDLISTLPLLVRPQTPRFFVVGDEATLGAAVHNNTNQSLTVAVDLFVQGVELVGDATREIEIGANRQAFVTWEVQVNDDASRVDLVFNAESEAANGRAYTDASRPPQGTLEGQGLPVYRYEAHETVGTSGQMTSGGTLIEAISLPSNMPVSEGELNIQISPSLAASMTDGLTYLEHFQYECVEQTISRFLPNVLTTRALKTAGLSDPELETNLETQVNTALQRLTNWQNADGGWGWWTNQESSVLTSTYAMLALVEAQEAGYTVSPGVWDRGVGFLFNNVAFLGSLEDSSLLNRQAFLLYVLARAHAPNVSAGVQLYDQRLRMDIYARAFLARTFFIVDPTDPRIQTLLSDFASEAITSATGTHWEEEADDYRNWNTDTRTTAIVLSTLSLLDPDNPLNGNAVRWLMNHRSEGHWFGTQETAWSLMALTNWMEASGELRADYQYAIALNGERLGGGLANRETLRQTHFMEVDLVDLLTDEANRLAFARDDGPGNLYYTAHMDLSLPVSQVEALDQGIVVSRSYYKLESSEEDLSEAEPIVEAEVGDLVLVRLTLVAPNALHYVIVEDPLPAGLEAVDQSLEVSPQGIQVPQDYGWEDVFRRGWGWWYFDHTQLRDEQTVLSANFLPSGTYIYTYLARASTPGTFNVIPPTAQEFYFPEVYGRGAGSTFVVSP